MVRDCCVCNRRAEGLIVYGEFVCFACHREVTGERPPKMVEVKRERLKARTLPKRRQIRDELITENLKILQKKWLQK